MPEESLDTAFGGAVKILQPRKGYRFSVEALLLARFAADEAAARVVDLGCGSGVVGLGVIGLLKSSRLLGVDVQEAFVERAGRSATLNGWSDRASFRCIDVREVGNAFKSGSADLVVSNPPFRSPASARVSQNEALAVARNEVLGRLADFAGAAAHLLTRGGSFCAVYPATRLDYLLRAAGDAGLMAASLRLVYPREGSDASFVLLQAKKGGAEPLRVLPPLLLHGGLESGEKYSDEARELIGPRGF